MSFKRLCNDMLRIKFTNFLLNVFLFSKNNAKVSLLF